MAMECTCALPAELSWYIYSSVGSRALMPREQGDMGSMGVVELCTFPCIITS